MSSRSEVLLWANRVNAIAKTAPPHQLLDMPANATAEIAQEAFHKIARMAHPDLHRNGLTPAELEAVTSAYAVVASAYQTFRSNVMATSRMKPVVKDGTVPATPAGAAPSSNAAQSMSSRVMEAKSSSCSCPIPIWQVRERWRPGCRPRSRGSISSTKSRHLTGN